MIGVDTNVLLRLFVNDDAAQVGRAEQAFANAVTTGAILVNPIVLSELVWTLRTTFKRPKREIVDLLEKVLVADDLEILFRGAASRALAAYRSGKADYPDYLIACINAEAGCSSTLTFDADALDFEEFKTVD